jgi:hypothetical protein
MAGEYSMSWIALPVFCFGVTARARTMERMVRGTKAPIVKNRVAFAEFQKSLEFKI